MEHITSADGTTIGYQHSGAGQPLLLVHGTTADHTRWSAITPAFEKYFSVYRMDRRGRGGSADSPAYTLMREAEDVAAVLEAMPGPASILSHSYGAVCSLEGALLTDRVRRLVLYEPPIPTGVQMYPPGVPDRVQALVDGGDLEDALEVFFREIVRMPEQDLEDFRRLPMWQRRIQLAPTIAREMVIDRSYQFEPEKFSHFQVPTLLLLGSDSPLIFRQATKVLTSVLPNSQVVELPGQQHTAMDTSPELFVKEVLKFLLAQ